MDGKYSNSRHPDSITYCTDIYEDLKRRDFTINAMAIDVRNGNIIDAHGGMEDIKKGIIRAIGNPDERFAEDGLRILRACRFAAQLDFQIEPVTLQGMIHNRDHLKNISKERIRDELLKTMTAEHPSIAFLYMQKTEILEYVLPELLEGVEVIEADGLRTVAAREGGLYRTTKAEASEPAKIKMIPYYAWANRSPGNMNVWIREQ